MKRYIVITQDEYNNLYYIGEYDNLDKAIPDVNEWLQVYDLSIDKLVEYSSTFNNCFDTELETKDGTVVMIRGFIL